MSRVHVPAEHWERIAEEAYSAQIAAEHKDKGKPIPVRTAAYGGYLYTVFGVQHGPWGKKLPSINAWRLVPLIAYDGETTTVYHDEEEIRAGLRKRGDMTGLIVSVKGKMMVCAEMVQFLLGLPRTRPLSLAEAQAYDARQRRFGWRSLWFQGKEPEWFSLRGHPVAVYRGHRTLGNDAAVLLWQHEGEVKELHLAAEDVALDPLGARREEEDVLETLETAAEPSGQLLLF
ncbi:hypothetical protein Hthe01_18570 [Hydrogenophilus thermoluteolus]|uniref:hypothetical protein n=1 Tax=Hydrogenophilus thermoluteolus TaxID=297 RepID=UPI0024A29207|nr:hypothetical protein [Hydrogenophilus thermoluteolus]GLW61508.1 hypothetical protein Hthe01_18570 [Hydrogenophilus thermoluteolus]